MRTNPAVILTQETDDNAVLSAMLAAHNIDTLDYPCIATRYFHVSKTQEIDDLGIADFPLYIFTSKRAVQGVAHMRDVFESVRADIACVGDSTERALEELLGISCSIKPETDNTGLGLAHAIIDEIPSPLSALYIKGNKSTGDLKQELEANGWEILELIVYENYTPDIKPLGSDDYRVAIFSSPSAVGRFFSVNPKLKAGLNCIAIGTTTAEYLRKIGVRQVFTAARPEKEELVKVVLNILNLE